MNKLQFPSLGTYWSLFTTMINPQGRQKLMHQDDFTGKGHNAGTRRDIPPQAGPYHGAFS